MVCSVWTRWLREAVLRKNARKPRRSSQRGRSGESALAGNFGQKQQAATAEALESRVLLAADSFGSPQVIASNADAAWSVTAADIDGDGDTDVVGGSYADGKVAWHENNGQQQFTEHVVWQNAGVPFSDQFYGDRTYSVRTADIDGDGDMDIVAGGRRGVRWGQNDGHGQFTRRDIIKTVQATYSVFAADIDGDGDIDVVSSASTTTDRIAWYENNGTGNFTAHVLTTSVNGGKAVFVADVDRDGDMDLMSGSNGDRKIVWYENNGSESFAAHNITTNAGAQSIFAADVDRDGDLDVLAAADNKVLWYENNGSQAFSERTLRTNLSGARSIVAADVEGDGDVDVLVASHYDNSVRWFENGGSQNFTERVLTSRLGQPHSVAVADVDSDGDLDVLTASRNDDTIAWIEQAVFVSISTSSSSVGEDDVNTVVFTLTRTGSTAAPLTVQLNFGGTATLGVDYTQSGATPSGTSGTLIFAVGSTTAVVTVDPTADSDEEPDDSISLTLIAGDRYSLGDMKSATTLLINDEGIDLGDAPDSFGTSLLANGARHHAAGPTLGSQRDTETTTSASDTANTDDLAGVPDDEDGVTFGTLQVGDLGAAVTVNVQNAPSGAKLDAWIDFNRDGSFGDSTEQIANNLSVVEGDNVVTFDIPSWAVDGTATARFRLSTSGNLGPRGGATDGEVEDHAVTIALPIAGPRTFGPQQVISTSGDFPRSVMAADMDSDGDMDVLSGANNGVFWHENDGQQSFTTRTISTAATGTLFVFAADVDGDGDLDALSATGNRLEWYENDGSQNFTSRVITTNVSGPHAVIVADMDNDGDSDVLSASGNDSRVAWYENNGSQGFTQRSIATNANGAMSIYAMDIDRDGDMDVVCAAHNAGRVVWYENQNLVFAEHFVTTSDTFVRTVSAADLDGDGDTDLLAGVNGSNKVAWFENDGQQNFTQRVITTTANGASHVAAADVDGDGDMDVLSASFGDNTIAWYENNGSQSFTKRVITATADDAYALFVADMDNDGILDVLSASRDDDRIAWYRQEAPLPNVTLSVSPTSVVEDGATNITYQFSRGVASADPLVVNFTVGGTATISSDYAATGAAAISGTNGTITFAAGSATANLVIDPTADTTAEPEKTVEVTLANGTGYYASGTRTRIGVIYDDDSIIEVSISPSSVAEDDAAKLEYTFTRTGDTSGPLNVRFEANGTAGAISDYSVNGSSINNGFGTVSFLAGAASKTITVDPTNDVTVESDETVIWTIFSDPKYRIGAANSATGTIVNDDTNVTIAVSPAGVMEDGSDGLAYTFTRVGNTSGEITINLHVSGTALFNTDYSTSGASAFSNSAGTVTVLAGATSAVVTILPTADTAFEPDETVILNVANGSGYRYGGASSQAIGTIANDDTGVGLSVSPSSVAEDGSANLEFTFTRYGIPTDALTVNFTTGGNATIDTDFTQSGATWVGSSGTVTIDAGATTAKVIVDPIADETIENAKTVELTLAAGTGYELATTTLVTGTITDDDTGVNVSVSPDRVTEDGATNLVFTFTRVGETTNELPVKFELSGIGASRGSDYSTTGATFNGAGGTITFAAGSSTATLVVDSTTDSVVENDETVVVTVTSGSGYGVGGTNIATGIIANDDTTVTVAVLPSRVMEDGGQNLEYTFTRTGVTSGELAVNFTLSGEAIVNSDYSVSGSSSLSGSSGTITMTDGTSTATLLVTPISDGTVEPSESVRVAAVAGTGYTVAGDATSSAVSRINNDDTVVEITVSPGSVIENGSTNLEYTITRTGDPSASLQVGLTLSGTATKDSDYSVTGLSGTSSNRYVTLGAGVSSAKIVVDPKADNSFELTETAVLTIRTDMGDYVAGLHAQAIGTIFNDQPSVRVSTSSGQVTEDSGTSIEFTFTREGDTSNPLTINFSMSGTASPSSDYTISGADTFSGNTGTLTFPAGANTAQITILPVADIDAESIESVQVNVSSGSGYQRLSPTSASTTIKDDDVDNLTVDGAGRLFFHDDSSRNDRLTVTYDTATSEFVIADPNLVGLNLGTRIVETEVRVPLSLVTARALVVNAGGGHDRIDLSGLPAGLLTIIVDGGDGSDTLIGSAGSDTLAGSDGSDLLQGNSGDDRLRGGADADYLQGGAGNDRLFGQGASNDVLNGGDGNDTLDGGVGDDILQESGDLNLTLTRTRLIGRGTDTLIDIETASLIGGAGDNRLDASAFKGRVTILGGGGADTLVGGDGHDILIGDQGNDLIVGGAGNDTIEGHDGDDTLLGGSGNDYLVGDLTRGAGNDQIVGQEGRDSINGGGGIDKLAAGSGSGADVGDSIADALSEIDESFWLIFDGQHLLRP